MDLQPKGKQLEVLALPAKGHIVVLGTAGSGKTTIALLRAGHLSNLPDGGKVLLVTYNGALVEYMQGIGGSHPDNLTVENYHKFARGYLNSRGKMPSWDGILSLEEKENYISSAISELASENPSEPTLKRPTEFFVDEIAFIEDFGFESLKSYYNAERIGRGSARLTRKNREWIFRVYKRYQAKKGDRYDWNDIALHVYKELLKDNGKRRYTHIIVDEGQDFSPMMLKSLVAAAAEDGSFTFFGDVAQQIYGSRLSWRDSGIDVNKIWRFEVNYRNPSTIISFANDITNSVYWQQNDDMVEATVNIAEGPKPVLVEFSDKKKEIDWVVGQAAKISKTSSTVIICKNRADLELFRYELYKINCGYDEIKKTRAGFSHIKTVYLSTYHAVKGLEFDNVFVPFLTADKLPDPAKLQNAEIPENVYADEIKLLYIAVTRSKYGLYMSYSGKLSPLFPSDSDNYEFHREAD